MSNPVMVVRRQVHGVTKQPLGRGCWLWCPGCDTAHRITLAGLDGSQPGGAVWAWDGNLETPTFDPSLRVTSPAGDCHSYIRSGRWEFLSDCHHHLAGQTVDMVPLPDWLAR